MRFLEGMKVYETTSDERPLAVFACGIILHSVSSAEFDCNLRRRSNDTQESWHRFPEYARVSKSRNNSP